MPLYSVELDHSMSIFKEYIISSVYLYIYLLWDVKVNACVEPRFKVNGPPHVWEVKQINATRSKTPWDAVCRIVIFRSVAVHLSIPKQLQISIRTRVHSCPKKLKTVYPRVSKHHVDAYPHMFPKSFSSHSQSAK